VKPELAFETVYADPPQDVWRALTDPAALADWLMDNDFLPRRGHRFHFRLKPVFGFERKIACQVLEVDEPRLLSFTWGGPGSVVTFRLEAVEGGTRLRLEHTGFSGARGFASGWILSHGMSIVITLPDGSQKPFESGARPIDIAQSISPRLADAAIVAKLNGELVDLTRPIDKDANLQILTARDPESLVVYRHSTAHLLAAAVLELYPETKLGIGPPIENGFYYDFDRATPFTPEDLEVTLDLAF